MAMRSSSHLWYSGHSRKYFPGFNYFLKCFLTTEVCPNNLSLMRINRWLESPSATLAFQNLPRVSSTNVPGQITIRSRLAFAVFYKFCRSLKMEISRNFGVLKLLGREDYDIFQVYKYECILHPCTRNSFFRF